MINIRKNIFETNSSSTHSIAISKEPVNRLPERVVFEIGEFGWEKRTVHDTASYLYTAILFAYDKEEADEKLEKLKDMLDSMSVKYEFIDDNIKVDSYTTGNKTYTYYDIDGYVDHSSECKDFIEAVLNDIDLFKRFMFGNSCIYTGNDNVCEYPEERLDCCAYDNNKFHEKEKYDYYFKGN